MKKLIAKSFGVHNAQNFKRTISESRSNAYIMLGRSVGWANVSNSSNLDDSSIDYPYDTVSYRNDVMKKGIILKRVVGSDMQPVVPRIDWLSGTVYTQYDQTANLFLKITQTALANGTVNVSINTLANTITTTNVAQLNLAASTPPVTTGNFVVIGDEKKEIIKVNTAGDFIQVNSDFSQSYTSNTIYKFVSYDYQYANKFYVRNNLDQVFKCLFNNNGAPSTIKPEITLGGQLPQNPYIETSDGYKWKYLYTIPNGLKIKFFTEKYMPVVSEPIVVNNTENGRIDIVEILNPGNGYFQGTTTNNYNIITVAGDGSDAQFTVDVQNGKIVEVNIIDGGSDYTNATLSIEDVLKLPSTSNASLRAIISPPGGHGYDPALELGASELMLSVDFQSNVEDYYPIKSGGETDFRQVALINELKTANNSSATVSLYPMYTKIFVSAPSSSAFPIDSTLFVGSGGNFANATFTATVVYFDAAENVAYVNDIVGDVDLIDGQQIYEKNNTSNYSQVFAVTKPDINILSGNILYIENRNKITRHANQTETIKIVVEF
jgi:hypothetical protein